ncbi:unnamed protein product [Periconia digitata]|uniref:Uncharacterized protein n=1 Tax=Periconia digitata TaxID=1303443 RepID=A0A9W4XFT6_9PLEO|nr:unnamed protein product [Periconia digitata]
MVEALYSMVPAELVDMILDRLLLSWSFAELVVFCAQASLSAEPSGLLFKRWLQVQQDDICLRPFSGTKGELLFLEEHVQILRTFSVSVVCYIPTYKDSIGLIWRMTRDSKNKPKSCTVTGRHDWGCLDQLTLHDTSESRHNYLFMLLQGYHAWAADLTPEVLQIVRSQLSPITQKNSVGYLHAHVYNCLSDRGFSGVDGCECSGKWVACSKCKENGLRRFVVFQGDWKLGCVRWHMNEKLPIGEPWLRYATAFRKLMAADRADIFFEHMLEKTCPGDPADHLCVFHGLQKSALSETRENVAKG